MTEYTRSFPEGSMRSMDRPGPADTKLRRGSNVATDERWVSAIAGSLLGIYGLSKRSRAGVGLALLGGTMLARGVTGHCNLYQALGVNTARRRLGPRAVMTSGEGVRVEEAVTIDRPASELYGLWRDLKNLPRFMRHVESVEVLDTKKSHWMVKGPMNQSVKWYAEIVNDEPNSLIGWRSVPGSEVETAGSVHFRPAPTGSGTEVRVILRYAAPGGMLGTAVAWLLGEEPGQQVRSDLLRFKQLMEAGTTTPGKGQWTEG